jgi:hypothetical protein
VGGIKIEESSVTIQPCLLVSAVLLTFISNFEVRKEGQIRKNKKVIEKNRNIEEQE